MIYVADTHALIWALTRPRALGKRAARVFRRAQRGLDEIHVSSLSIFEILQLFERGRLKSPLDWRGWVEALDQTPGLVVEPLTIEDVAYARGLQALADPFDRLIVATAQRLDAPMVTKDEGIGESGFVEALW